MANGFTDVGFFLTEENYEEEMERMIHENIDKGVTFEEGGETYLLLPIDNRIQLWFPFNDNTINIYDAEMHYATATFYEADSASWCDDAEGEESGLCTVEREESSPFNMIVPAPIMAPKIVENKKYKCQAACFAMDLSFYPDEKAYHENDPYGEYYSEQSFIPTGMFPVGEDGELSSMAHVTGYIRSLEKRTNGFTGLAYYSITVDSFGGAYEILADPEFISDDIVTGMVVSADVRISGQLMQVFYGDELMDLKRPKAGNPHMETLGDLYHALRHAWSKETAYPSCKEEWNKRDASYGQCAITAMLVHDMFGGTIHKIRVGNGTHYFNKLNGIYVDLTSEQFDLYYMKTDYEHNTVVDRKYCGKNPDTKKRYDLLVARVAEYLKTLD